MTTSRGPAARTRRTTGARRATKAELVAALLAVLGACNDASDEPTTTTTTAGPTTTDATTSTTTSAPETTTTSPGDVDPADFEDSAGVASFSTPSGDIGCVLDERSARCDVLDADFDPPPTPPDCQLDHGHAVIVEGDEAGSFLCAGDTVVGSDRVLEDGQTLRYGNYRCRHADWDGQEGVGCSHVSNGHGFRLSVSEYLLY